MKKKCPYIIPAFFSALLALPLLALLLLQGAQLVLKQTAAARMKVELLQTIHIPADEVVWEKEGKEVVLDGKMFDIRDYTLSNGILSATGFFDEEETGILHFLAEHATGKNAGRSLLQLLLFAQCFVAGIGWFPALLFWTLRQKKNSLYHTLHADAVLLLLVPPPRFH